MKTEEGTKEGAPSEPQKLAFKPGRKFIDWRIVTKLDEGGFGKSRL